MQIYLFKSSNETTCYNTIRFVKTVINAISDTFLT